MRRRLVGLFAIGFALGTAVDGLAQASGSDLTVGRPTVLFEGGYTRNMGRTFPEYDVSLDGGHFLMVAPGIPAAKALGRTRRSRCRGTRAPRACGMMPRRVETRWWDRPSRQFKPLRHTHVRCNHKP